MATGAIRDRNQETPHRLIIHVLRKAPKQEVRKLLIRPLPPLCLQEEGHRRQQRWMAARDEVEKAHSGEVGEEPGWSGEALQNLQCLKVGERGCIVRSH